MDEQRLEVVEERLDTLNKLKRKYGGTIEAVFSRLEAIEKELSEVHADELTPRAALELIYRLKALLAP